MILTIFIVASLISLSVNELMCFLTARNLKLNTNRMFMLGLSPIIDNEWCTFEGDSPTLIKPPKAPILNLNNLAILDTETTTSDMLHFPPCLLKPLYARMVRKAVHEQEKLSVALT